MHILITGGAGFIGSHTMIRLLETGHDLIVLDNLSNSQMEVLGKIHLITHKYPIFYPINLATEPDYMLKILKSYSEEHPIDAVIHFASLKAVYDSIQNPIKYYDNNLIGMINLLKAMEEIGCRNLIFSSSATVYGDQPAPVHEDMPIGRGVTNPYGKSKFMIEEILQDLPRSTHNSSKDQHWKIIALRYFNPIGSHPSGLIGELIPENEFPNNLMPYLLGVAKKLEKYPELKVFGTDYSTQDGSCERDFIHVMDLAEGHLSALNHMFPQPKSNLASNLASNSASNSTSNSISNYFKAYNLGTGKPTSVLQLIETFQKVNQVPIPYQLTNRREGDLASIYANVDKARKELNWEAQLTVEDMCRDAWNFAKQS